MGTLDKASLARTDRPMKRKIMKPVTLCSMQPRNWGFSPGAEVSGRRRSQKNVEKICFFF